MELSLKDLRELIGNLGADTSLKIGGQYLLRTVTLYFTGRIVAITSTDVVLEDAAWIADTGRFADAIKAVQFNEVEPITGRHIVFRGGLIDATSLDGTLPRSQK